MSKPILYSYWRSSATFRVRIALAYKGIDYELRPVSIVKGGTGDKAEPEYHNINPLGQVPSLVVQGTTLTQSLAIIEYLEETYPEKPLLPKDPILRARARQIAEIVNSGIQPLHNLATMNKLAEVTGDSGKILPWNQHFIAKGSEALERILEKTAGKFCVGDEVTIADLALVPHYLGVLRFDVDVTPFPIMTRIYNECMKLEAFKTAHLTNQPDCPPEFKK